MANLTTDFFYGIKSARSREGDYVLVINLTPLALATSLTSLFLVDQWAFNLNDTD